MAEITEAQARRICWALGVNPDVTLACYGEPNWRIVQRAAAEGGEKSAALSAGEIAPKKGEG